MNNQQLSLFIQSEITQQKEQFDELPLEPLEFGLDHTHNGTELANTELLTIKLFKDAILQTEGNEDDSILKSFVENVLPNLMKNLAGTTAKGGLFFDYLDQQVREKPIRRENAGDQSNVAHLLNGLFPTYRIIKISLDLSVTNQVKRFCDNIAICLYICAYLLHDFEKFPDYTSWILSVKPEFKETGEKYAKKSDAPNFAKEYLTQKIKEFGLDKFLGENWEIYLNDIIWISHNAGDGQDADRGLESRGLTDYQLDSKTRGILSNLVKLSDKLASMIKHPRDINQDSILDLIGNISNHQLRFTYHSLSDNRGVLTNIINNALMDIHPKEYYTALLYLPDGVVYLAKIDAPNISTEEIPQKVVDEIYFLCKEKILTRCVGVGRDDIKRRLKLAPYVNLLLNKREIIAYLAPRAIFKFTQSLDKLSNALKEKQKNNQAPKNVNFDLLIFDGKVDRLGKMLSLILSLFNDKTDEIELKLLSYLKLDNYLEDFKQFSNDSKGGTIYRWFYIASRFYDTKKEISPEEEVELIEDLAMSLSQYLGSNIIGDSQDQWQDLKSYVSHVISFVSGVNIKTELKPFITEFKRYQAAKITGKGKRENVCAMSSSSYTVTKQKETATLFMPQVYSNRQILFNKDSATRKICSIWSIEIMLRQILMNNTNATGGDFEERKYRYLYLYPTYFFTPETNKFLHLVYSGIYRSRFDADIKKHLVSDNVANFSLENYQNIDSLLIQENLNSEEDRTFKLSYPSDQPITFFFMALPPGKDATDTESWVMPAWLALVLPLILDVKTVVSESPVPPFISGADFEKTVILDGVHQAIHSLIKQDEYRLDSILPRASNNSKFSPLNALSAAYAIHLDVNRKKDGNPNWGKLTELASNLETSPLYVFHYLNQWTRGKDTDIPSISRIKLYTYDFYPCFDPYVHIDKNTEEITLSKESALNHPLNLTLMYRKFYRANKQFNPKSNAVLKPIDVAAKAILDADLSFQGSTLHDSLSDIEPAYQCEGMVAMVAAELNKLMDRVHSSTAEGRWVFNRKQRDKEQEEREAILAFAQYFVVDVFENSFKGDRARLAGRQLNLLRDTCEFLYRLEQDKENRQNRSQETQTNEEESDES